MLTQTCLRAYCAGRLCRELQSVAVVGSLSSSPSSSLSDSCSTLMTQRETRRGHYVVQRRWWLPYIPNIDDMSKYPYDEHAPGDFHVYDTVRATHEEPRPDINVILTKYVEGYGDLGDSIMVPSGDARNYLIPAQLAVYDTPENRQRMLAVRTDLKLLDRVQRTPFAALTARELEDRLTLPIVMNPSVPWKVEKFHVMVALRKVGVVVESEDCLQIPDYDIVEPCDIRVQITVNDTDVATINAKVVNWFVDLDGIITHEPFEIWRKPKEGPKDWFVTAAEPIKKLS